MEQQLIWQQSYFRFFQPFLLSEERKAAAAGRHQNVGAYQVFLVGNRFSPSLQEDEATVGGKNTAVIKLHRTQKSLSLIMQNMRQRPTTKRQRSSISQPTQSLRQSPCQSPSCGLFNTAQGRRSEDRLRASEEMERIWCPHSQEVIGQLMTKSMWVC